MSLSVSPDGKQGAIAYFDGPAELWDVESRALITELSLVKVRDRAKYKGDTRAIQQCLRWLEKDVERSHIQLKGPIVFLHVAVSSQEGCLERFGCGMRQHTKSVW